MQTPETDLISSSSVEKGAAKPSSVDLDGTFLAQKNKDSNFDFDCHLEYKERFDYYFDHARDTVDINTRHPGVHQNIHIAEVFYKEIIK
jgi:hypothetical protein